MDYSSVVQLQLSNNSLRSTGNDKKRTRDYFTNDNRLRNFIWHGLLFSYFLVPAALNFFINYGSEVVEPFWSFNQYFDFIAVLIFTTE